MLGQLNALSTVYIVLSYLAGFIFIAGITRKIYIYLSTPSPLRIPLTPAPRTTIGVIARVAREALVFRTLFRADKRIWFGGLMFHAALLLALLDHFRFSLIGFSGAGYLLILSAIYLLSLRIAIDRIRRISSGADYFALLLIGLIAVTGVIMKLSQPAAYISAVDFITGLSAFAPVEMPRYPIFMAHFSLVLLFMIYFPFSKMIHAGSMFFSPTLNQADNRVAR